VVVILCLAKHTVLHVGLGNTVKHPHSESMQVLNWVEVPRLSFEEREKNIVRSSYAGMTPYVDF